MGARYDVAVWSSVDIRRGTSSPPPPHPSIMQINTLYKRYIPMTESFLVLRFTNKSDLTGTQY